MFATCGVTATTRAWPRNCAGRVRGGACRCRRPGRESSRLSRPRRAWPVPARGRRGLAHLARAEEEHGGKLAGEAAQTVGVQAIPHARILEVVLPKSRPMFSAGSGRRVNSRRERGCPHPRVPLREPKFARMWASALPSRAFLNPPCLADWARKRAVAFFYRPITIRATQRSIQNELR